MITRLKLLLVIPLLLAGIQQVAHAEDGVGSYAYSVFVGTGKYRVGGRTIYVIRAPLAFTLKETDYENRKIGYRLLAPVSVGITNFETIDELPDLNIDDLQSMAFAPGLEVQIPLTDNWAIKPFGQVGFGFDFKSSNNSFIWGLGARTRASFGKNDKWLVGGEVLWAGNNPKYEELATTHFTRLGGGAEYKWQTDWSPFNQRVSWHTRLIQWYYSNEVDFVEPPSEIELEYGTEIGVSFGINPGINILGYTFRQGGIGYERGKNFKAVKLFTTFPF